MEEKEVKINPITKEVEVPVELSEAEYSKLYERFNLFNEDILEEDKLTFEEYLSLVFKTNLLEEELILKKRFSAVLNSNIKELEEDLKSKYSIGLEGSSELLAEVIKKRMEASNITVEESNYKSDYINLLVTHISTNVYAFGVVEHGVLTLKEDLVEDVKKNPSDVLTAINIVIDNVEEPDPTAYNYESEKNNYDIIMEQLIEFEKYVNLI